MTYYLLQSATSSFWPVTMVGWGTVFGLIVTVGGGIFALGKFYAALNGFGTRLTDVEKALEESRGDRSAIHRQVDRVLDQHAMMIEKLGEARRSSEKCGEDVNTLAYRIENKIDAMRELITHIDKELSAKIAALEATGRRLHHGQ